MSELLTFDISNIFLAFSILFPLDLVVCLILVRWLRQEVSIQAAPSNMIFYRLFLFSFLVSFPNAFLTGKKRTNANNASSGIILKRSSPHAPVRQQSWLKSSKSTASLAVETKETENAVKEPKVVSKLQPIFKVASITFGTTATFFLNNHYDLGPISSSGIIGLFSAIVLPEPLALASLCGSFAGMARTPVVPGLPAAAMLGLFTSGVSRLFDNMGLAIGVGGRLGLIAQISCTSQFILHSLLGAYVSSALGPLSSSAALVDFSLYRMPLSKYAQLAVTTTTGTVLGALFMRLWKDFFSSLSLRLSSSTAAVGAAGILSNFFPALISPGPFFAGSFVAMSAPSKINSLRGLILASLLSAVAQMGMIGCLLGGWGGKLGTGAFLGVALFMATKGLYSSLLDTTNVSQQ